MEWIKTFEGFLYEYIDKNTLRDVERYLDQSFKKIGMDIEFTNHFHDRLNDKRNKQDITTKELIDTFNASYREIGQKFVNYGDKFEAVLQDMQSNINIPFVLKINRRTGDLELVAKTIMRTSNFLTPERKIKVNK
jgi:histidinol phosphatase-like enzyme